MQNDEERVTQAMVATVVAGIQATNPNSTLRTEKKPTNMVANPGNFEGNTTKFNEWLVNMFS